MDLVGRSELIGDVVDVLTSAEMRQVVVLRGDAGAGKTVTALAIANELRAMIPAQLMVSGSSQAAFSSALANFATEHVQACNADTDEVLCCKLDRCHNVGGIGHCCADGASVLGESPVIPAASR